MLGATGLVDYYYYVVDTTCPGSQSPLPQTVLTRMILIAFGDDKLSAPLALMALLLKSME